MASVSQARPTWQDELGDDLDVEWEVQSSGDESEISPTPETGTWRGEQEQREWADGDEGVTEADMSLDPDLPQSSIRVSPVAVPVGTFVMHNNAPAQKVAQQQSASDRNLFSPTKLESLFQLPATDPSPPPYRPPPTTVSGPNPFSNPYAARLPSRLSQVHMPEPPTPTVSSINNSTISAMQDASYHTLELRPTPRSLAPSPSPSLSPNKLTDNPDRPDEIIESDIPHLATFAGRIKSDTFTFFSPAPRTVSGSVPVVTPGDPRLKLFHPGGYDTYTRAHLSGVLDSIGVESATPSAGSSSTPESGVSGSGSRKEGSEPPAKRMRIMPGMEERDSPFELSDPPRPRNPISRRDYVKESDAFMQAIREKAMAGSSQGSPSEPSITSSEERRNALRTSTRNSLPQPNGSDQDTIPSLSSGSGTASTSSRALAGSRQSQHAAGLRTSSRASTRQTEARQEHAVISGPSALASSSGPATSNPASHSGRPRRNSALQQSQQPTSGLLAPTSQADLNRYISTGSNPTARTVSTESRSSALSAGSTIPSFTKHPGPPSPLPQSFAPNFPEAASASQPTPNHPGMRMLRQEDVADVLGERVGKMKYNREAGKWVKRQSLSGVTEESTQSDDVFRGIPDFAQSDADDTDANVEMPEQEDEQELEREGTVHEPPPPLIHLPSAPAVLPSSSAPSQPMTPAIVRANSAPVPRSALKSNGKSKTSIDPFAAVPPRSVSFSDGRTIGPILGLGRRGKGKLEDKENEHALASSEEDDAANGNTTVMASTRTKRIQGMLEDFGELSIEDNNDQDGGESSDSNPFSQTPSRPSRSRAATRGSLSTASTDNSPHALNSFSLKRKSSRSFARVDATFLTECSFGVAHDDLIKYITEEEGYEPHWDRLRSIDLHGKKMESVARLKEFLPVLEQINLDDNRIAWLTGLPRTVLHLSAASNALTGLTAYTHVSKLRQLNISRNQVDSFQQLAGLAALRELHADDNCATSLDGLYDIPLRILSIKGNKIQNVDIRLSRWYDLEQLDLSQNQIKDLQGVELLQSLIALNLDGNRLEYFSVVGSRVSTLWILRISDNRLSALNIAGLDHLKTLYADNNQLSEVVGLEDCRTLENFSLRNQAHKLRFTSEDIRGVKRLYLSGNPLSQQFFSSPMSNLRYGEFSSCQLANIRPLLDVLPSVAVLVLNWNHFRDVNFLRGLASLRKVTAVGCRIDSLAMESVLSSLDGLEELDLRMNTFTLGWYLPVSSEASGAKSSSATGVNKGDAPSAASSAEDRDKKYRRGLPNELYVPRLMWRGLVMEFCPGIRRLDGLDITEKDRVKTDKLLDQLKVSGVVLDGR